MSGNEPTFQPASRLVTEKNSAATSEMGRAGGLKSTFADKVRNAQQTRNAGANHPPRASPPPAGSPPPAYASYKPAPKNAGSAGAANKSNNKNGTNNNPYTRGSPAKSNPDSPGKRETSAQKRQRQREEAIGPGSLFWKLQQHTKDLVEESKKGGKN
mgnify:CR=1 FL=1